MANHTCHARNCQVPVQPRMFMCRRHWFRLPKHMRDSIWATYVPGQEQRKDPSPEYLEAAKACIEYVALLESSSPQQGTNDRSGVVK